MLAILAAIAFAVAFVLHWAGGGHNPIDVTGLALLGLFLLALHLIIPVAVPWRRGA